MKKVVLYGNSLVMSAIGASLQGCPDLNALPVNYSMPAVQQHVIDFQPDAVILDLAEIKPFLGIELWKVQPDLLLIAVDLMKGQSLVFFSYPARLLTTTDLIQLIRNSHT